MKISAKTKKMPNPVEVEVDVPEELHALTAKFGDAVVASRARSALIIDIQAYIRRLIEHNADPKNKDSQKNIHSEVAKWKPDVRSGVRTSSKDKLLASVDSLTDEQKRELLAKLTGSTPAKASHAQPQKRAGI